MNKVKVEIIKPIIDDQKKGDINLMKKSDAIKYEKEGLVKILQNKITNKNKIVEKNIECEQISPVKQIFERHKNMSDNAYIEIFAGDDKKTGQKPYNPFFKLSEINYEKLIEESEIHNFGVYGVFLNINLLTNKKRVKENIEKILYVFIDLDDATEEHNLQLKEKLKNLGISYSYNAKSGHGYHFLIPVDLDKSKENNIKLFLNYMKENCTNKVDLATSDLGRLMRFPESIHKKDDEEKKLITLHSHMPNDSEIKNNSELILKYQLEQKKGQKDLHYELSIKRNDIFFSRILDDIDNWDKYHNILSNSKDRNNYFIKNLGFFISENIDYESKANLFLKNWESSRVAAMQGWKKKSIENKMQINYYELLKWSKDNEIKIFIDLLNKQLESSFLDRYEFYYLEDEKKESSHLMYYPMRDYFVNKGLNDILLNVYYDCIESGIDLVKELNLDIVDDWENFSFKKQLSIILNNIHKKIIFEKRLKTVFNINYAPIDDKFVYIGKKKYFNTYNKTELWDYNKCESKYQFENIKDLIMNLCGGEKEHYDYFNKWLAWIIQNPTQKLPTAIILQGRQGSGKGTFKTLILDEIFGNNCQEINQTHLESSFNEYLMGKQIIVANEVMHNDNRQTLPNVLKNLVTDEYITISRKFKKEIVSRNYTHWIFCTNSDNPLKIDEDDRRYSVFYSKKLPKNFGHTLRKNIDYERKEYISYLKSLKVDFEDVSEPLMNEAKKEIIDLNKDSVEKFRENLQQFESLYDAYINIFGHDKELKIMSDFGDGRRYIPTDNFYLLYEKYCENMKEIGRFNKPNFSKKLSNKGIKTIPKWNENKTHRTYDIDLINQWIKIN